VAGSSVDIVQFALAPIPFRRADVDAGDDVVFVSVNGRDLIEAIHTYERRLAVDAGYKPPLPYAALPADRVLPPSLQWLGRPSEDLTHGDWIVVFTCGCGDWSCGGLLARIDVGDDLVVWSDFQTPYIVDRITEQSGMPTEGDVSRDGLGPFRFKRSQYEAALRHPVRVPWPYADSEGA
jgi:hypothetical protein